MPSAIGKNRALAVGLTGGFGTGKSTVLAMFRKKGARVFDADRAVHALFKDGALKAALKRRFGPAALTPRGAVNKKALAALVFDKPAERRDLEKIIHPLVRRRLEKDLARMKTGVAVVDVPLLYESKWDKRFDLVVVVTAGKSARINRLKARGYDTREFERRAKAQWPLEKKARKADIVIDNGGPLKRTQTQVDEIWTRLTNHARVVRGKNGLA